MELKVKVISCEKMHTTFSCEMGLDDSSGTRSIWLVNESSKPISHSIGGHMPYAYRPCRSKGMPYWKSSWVFVSDFACCKLSQLWLFWPTIDGNTIFGTNLMYQLSEAMNGLLLVVYLLLHII